VNSLRPGVRLALDWGDARIGVAACDAGAVLAYPLTTVVAGDTEIDDLARLVAEHQPLEVLVGLPRSLSGTEGPAAAKARERAARLSSAITVPVRLVDERLTTVTAARRLRESGKRARQQRPLIDAAAAAAILEQALAAERAGPSPPGELVSPGPGDSRSP
jgi:putative Holliday junction resolvase